MAIREFPDPAEGTVSDPSGPGGALVHLQEETTRISGLTEDTTPASADFVMVGDVSASDEHKKVKVSNLMAAGAGEANTASNVGTAGVGPFKTKTGVDLEFKNINAGSSKISVTDDAGDDEIDLDVVEANVDHDALLNFDIAKHRIINDAGTSTTELWSASKIDGELSTLIAGIDLKEGVDTSTTGVGNITLSGEQTLNGLLTSASRVLVAEQTLPQDNGIYVSAAGAWSRAADADTDAEVTNGNLTHVVNSGSTKFKFKYLLVTPDNIIVGTTAQTWEEHRDIDFGTTAGTAAEGNDSRIPSQDENDALVGTDGVASAANEYVTDSDPRNTDSRTPTAHAIGGAEHSADTLANLNTKVSDATLDDSGAARTPSLHAIGGAEHSADTLANLNAKVSDATLDDSGATRTPSAHALGGAEHTADTLANLNSKVSDATLIDTADARLSDDRTANGVRTATTVVSVSASAAPAAGDVLKATSPSAATWQAVGSSPHAMGGADHTADTLANLNTKVSDATLDDSSATRTPSVHALGGAEHSADTLANLNTKVSDATLIDTGDARLSDERTANAVATTGSDVNVDASAPPSTGQILKATSATTATWQAVGSSPHAMGGGDHTADTLANLNTKVSDATLDDSGASRPPTAHALGGAEHSADTLANLNAKVSDATLIDTGDARLSDDRTASGLRSATTVVSVSAATAPTVGQVLKATSGTVATWQAEAGGGASNQPTALARRTTTQAITATFADIAFDATDVENDTATVEHDNTNTDRITLKEAGVYRITYHANISAPSSADTTLEIQARVRANDTTVLAGSDAVAGVVADGSLPGNDLADFVTRSFVYDATAADFVSLQIQHVVGGGVGTSNVEIDATLEAVRLTGVKGDTGAAGSGTTLTLKEDGTNLANTPHDAINFASGVIASDNGDGSADVVGAPDSALTGATGDITTTSTTDVIATSMVETPPAGTYLYFFSGSVDNTTNAAIVRMSVHIDGVQEASSETRYQRGNQQTSEAFVSVARVVLNGSQQVEGRWRTSAGTGTMHQRNLARIRVS